MQVTATSTDGQRVVCQFSVTVTGTFTPPPGTLAVTCPASRTALSTDGDPVPVLYSATTVGGTAPITITYNPASGSLFSVGQTAVAVSATSTDGQKAVCAFSVVVETLVRGPQVSITCPAGAVALGLSDNVQNAVTAQPAGTTFCFATGTRILPAPIQEKTGDKFYCQYGAVISGNDSTVAMTAHVADNVQVYNCVVERFTNPVQTGALSCENHSGCVFAYNEARLNFGYGIRTGQGAQIRRNNAHHNGQMGISGVGNDVLVEGNEIAYNNTNNNDPGFEAGGSKFTNTNSLIVRGNFVHHNSGPGLWTDINNINCLYENNVVEDNTYMGIFHEISYACIIRNNAVRRNGLGFSGWIWGAGILVAASPNVEIYGNTLDGNADGIGAAQQTRTDSPSSYGPHEISNLYVHDNDVTQTQGWTGLAQDVGDTTYFSSRNNRFLANIYHVSGVALLFTWDNQELTLAQWQAKGLQ